MTDVKCIFSFPREAYALAFVGIGDGNLNSLHRLKFMTMLFQKDTSQYNVTHPFLILR